MNAKVAKWIKLGVSVVGVGVTLATNYFADKDLDSKVAKKVAEELAKTTDKES